MNTSISPARLPATPVAEVPSRNSPIGDVGLSFNDCGGVTRGGVGNNQPLYAARKAVTEPCPQSPFHSLQAEFVAVAVAWFAVLTATALGGLL